MRPVTFFLFAKNTYFVVKQVSNCIYGWERKVNVSFFKKRFESGRDINIWVDDPNYGVIIEDDVPVGEPRYSTLKYSEEREVRELVARLCDILKLPKNANLVEIDISFK